MKIVALLTGRGNNTLKDKNIIPVLGKPLLYYPAMAAKNCSLITEFYCSSDCDKILSAASDLGYKPIKRPPELSLPTSQHVDAILHGLKVMENDGVKPDILVVLLANSGIIKKEWVLESINALIDNPALSAACPVEQDQDHHPYRAKRIRQDGCLEPYFDFSDGVVSTNRQDLCENYYFCHNFWTLRIPNSIFSDQPGQPPWSFMGNNIKPIVIEDCFDVHDLDDVARTERWIQENWTE